MKTFLNITALMLIAASGYAQQDPQFNQYIFNEMIINPAYAGTKGVLNIGATYSLQWTGFSGSPTTQTVSIEGPVSKNMGLGLHFINDKIGAQTQQGLFGSYSYQVRLGEKFKLAMGLAAGISNFTLDGTKLTVDNPEDPAIPKDKVSRVRFDSKAGLFLYSERFYAGFSVTDLLADVIKSDNLLVTGQSRHYYLTSGYVFDLGSKFKFKPSFLIREDFKAPTNIDVNAFFLYKEKLWLGATVRLGAQISKNSKLDNTLRHRDALAFMAEWNITDRLRLGYAYTLSLSALKNYSGHEIQIGYYFRTKSTPKMMTPRYF
jgi:type IX secretion system PorP/SprF family membrane protein